MGKKHTGILSFACLGLAGGLFLGSCSSDGTAGTGIPDLASSCGANQKMCSGACVTADVSNGCGGVDCTPCASGANGAPICGSGACALQCNVGYGDCDGNLSNGCEKDVTTDSANCGSCGFACPSGSTCTAGACPLIAPGQSSDQACLTIDAGTIYWATANANPGAVYSVPKAGGNVTQIARGLGAPRGIAVDATSVYFTTLTGGQIIKCPLAGCPANPTMLATGQGAPFGLTVDATNVYWTNRTAGTVMKCAIGGCNMTPTMVASGQLTPNEIAVDATNVYWANAGDGSIWKAPVGGGAASMLTATGMAGAHGVASDGAFVYYSQASQGVVGRVPVAGGSATTIAMGQKTPWGLAIDNMGLVVWSDLAAATMGGAITRAPITGGTAVTRASNQANPLCVAVDATTIYWINALGNQVQKVAK